MGVDGRSGRLHCGLIGNLRISNAKVLNDIKAAREKGIVKLVFVGMAGIN